LPIISTTDAINQIALDWNQSKENVWITRAHASVLSNAVCCQIAGKDCEALVTWMYVEFGRCKLCIVDPNSNKLIF